MNKRKSATNHASNNRDELIDLVDANDNVIGKEKRSVIYQKRLSNYRVINAFLVNSEGQLWIPRRTSKKTIFPNGLDVSVGGHVKSGESYEMAMRRELKEELNLDIHAVHYKLLEHINPYKHEVSSFMKVYEIQQNRDPAYNPLEFIESFWLTPEEVVKKIRQEKYPPKSDLLKLVNLFYLN